MNERLKTFLMVSVIFNALFIGVVLGQASHTFSTYVHPATPGISTDCCSAALDKLPEAKRKLLSDIMQPAWKQMHDVHNQIDEEKKKTLDILKAKTFNEKAYRAEVQHILVLHAQMKHDMTDAVTKLANLFTTDERIILADIVAHSFVSPPAQQPQ